MAYLGDISPFKFDFGLDFLGGRKGDGGLSGKISGLESEVELGISKLKGFDFDVKNPYQGMQNPFEDLTVDTKATELRQQGLAQQQADILQGLRGGVGSSGAAALASGLARQGAAAQREISADLSQQEQAIKLKQKTAEQQLMEKRAVADMEIETRKQDAEYGRMEQLLGFKMSELTAAEQARKDKEAEDAAFGGAIGSVLLGGLGGAIGGPVGASLGSSLGGALGSSL